MKKSRFTQAQIAFVLRQAEEGVSVAAVCQKTAISLRPLIGEGNGGKGVVVCAV